MRHSPTPLRSETRTKSRRGTSQSVSAYGDSETKVNAGTVNPGTVNPGTVNVGPATTRKGRRRRARRSVWDRGLVRQLGLTVMMAVCVGVAAYIATAFLPIGDSSMQATAWGRRTGDQSASHDTQRARTPVVDAPSTKANPGVKAARPAAPPKPVAGLNQKQMNNAARIVAAGKALGLPKRAFVIAVACAMQESNLYNRANVRIPESYRYPHEGTGSDHDSLGLFQQRPSTGWGTVRNIMQPPYAAAKFYRALVQISNWQRMSLTRAAQAVQGSAYPYAYAKHETRAQIIVNALTA